MARYIIELPDELEFFMKKMGYDPKSFILGQFDMFLGRVRERVERELIKDNQDKIDALMKLLKDQIVIK